MKIIKIIVKKFSILSFILFISCNYRIIINTFPDDAMIKVDNIEVKSNSVFKSKNKKIDVLINREGYEEYKETFLNKTLFNINKYSVNLKPKNFSISFSTVDNKSKISIDNEEILSLPLKTNLTYGEHSIKLLQKDYDTQEFKIFVSGDTNYKFRHQKKIISKNIKLTPLGIIDCGKQPKQVNFSFDDKYIFVSLLDDYGFDIINVKDLSLYKKIKVENSDKKGYVEGLFIDKYKSFFISQMTTGYIYEFNVEDYEEIKYIRKIHINGLWPKVIAYSEKKGLIAVSNWCSNDISIIEYTSGNIIKKIENIVVPRGIVFSNDGNYLYITSFEGGKIFKYNIDEWKMVEKISNKGAPRHIVLNKDNTLCYVSDMASNSVYEIDTNNFKILNTFKVYNNPNTIDITPDDKYLFVSCRGPNNPEGGYLEKSLENGKIIIIDCEKKEIIGEIEGGLQPTGLDISNNGKIFAFSNFQSNNVEIYRIEY